MVERSCYYCTVRNLNCHSSCLKYKEYKDYLEHIKENKKQYSILNGQSPKIRKRKVNY